MIHSPLVEARSTFQANARLLTREVRGRYGDQFAVNFRSFVDGLLRRDLVVAQGVSSVFPPSFTQSAETMEWLLESARLEGVESARHMEIANGYRASLAVYLGEAGVSQRAYVADGAYLGIGDPATRAAQAAADVAYNESIDDQPRNSGRFHVPDGLIGGQTPSSFMVLGFRDGMAAAYYETIRRQDDGTHVTESNQFIPHSLASNQLSERTGAIVALASGLDASTAHFAEIAAGRLLA